MFLYFERLSEKIDYEEEIFYTEEILDNYQELAINHPKAAAELVSKFGKGKWQKHALFRYPKKEDYEEYELKYALTDSLKGLDEYETESGEIVASAWGFEKEEKKETWRTLFAERKER